jgi:membrane-associated HD superfamily phosphohydrolase
VSLMHPHLGHDLDHGSVSSSNARAVVVNRTHRVVRAEALTLQEQKQKSRSLWVPLAICSTLMLVLCYAIWFMLDGYDLTPNGIPDASDQMILLLLWSLPVTIVILGVVWVKRGRGRFGNGSNEVSR